MFDSTDSLFDIGNILKESQDGFKIESDSFVPTIILHETAE